MNRIRGVALVAVILSIVWGGCLVSCSQDPPPDSTVNTDSTTNYSEYCIFEPFEGTYAQVTFKTSQIIYPSVCTIEGKEYTVAVINGFENPDDARALNGTLEIQNGIMAINSNAFSKADNVTSVILPASCQSLGSSSLPPNPSEITLSTEAAKDLYRAISNKASLKTINLIGNGIASITGDFSALEKVQIIGESATAQAYWPSLPSFENTATRLFEGWHDAQNSPITSSTKITSLPTTVVLNGKQYYLYGVATPKFKVEAASQGAGGFFNIPYFMVATEAKYSFVFTDLGTGKYTIAPNTTEENMTYVLTLNGKEVDGQLSEGKWEITVEDTGSYVFSCFYKAEDGTVLGYGQINFNYKGVNL